MQSNTLYKLTPAYWGDNFVSDYLLETSANPERARLYITPRESGVHIQASPAAGYLALRLGEGIRIPDDETSVAVGRVIEHEQGARKDIGGLVMHVNPETAASLAYALADRLNILMRH